MKKKYLILFLCTAFLFLFTIVPIHSVQAANTLIPCGNDGVDASGHIINECNFGTFVQLIQNVMNFLIILTAPISVIAFAWIGVMLLFAQGDVGKIQRAKGIAWKVLVGFIIVLSAWLLVHVIAATFLDPSYNIFMAQTPSGT